MCSSKKKIKLFCFVIKIFRFNQNPPSIPGLFITFIVAKIRGARLIIDWHNYGYSMLALKHGPKHWIVQACQRYECFLGKLADVNLCVSDTFAKNLSVHMIK